MLLFNSEKGSPRERWVVVAIYIVVFSIWFIATGINCSKGTFELADIPSGLAAVLAAIPLATGVSEGLKRFGKGSSGGPVNADGA